VPGVRDEVSDLIERALFLAKAGNQILDLIIGHPGRPLAERLAAP
jgi:hypothetical protein